MTNARNAFAARTSGRTGRTSELFCLWRAFGATTGRHAEQQGNDKVPHGPTFFLPAWRERYRHALREADRCGWKRNRISTDSAAQEIECFVGASLDDACGRRRAAPLQCQILDEHFVVAALERRDKVGLEGPYLRSAPARLRSPGLLPSCLRQISFTGGEIRRRFRVSAPWLIRTSVENLTPDSRFAEVGRGVPAALRLTRRVRPTKVQSSAAIGMTTTEP
jgi:hypothetical protein